MEKTLAIGLMLINTVVAVTGQIFLKIGMNRVKEMGTMPIFNFFLSSFTNPAVIFGCFCYGLSMMIWLVVLSKVDLSFAYPLIAMSYVAVLFVSAIFLHETITTFKIIGVTLIVLGVIFISRS